MNKFYQIKLVPIFAGMWIFFNLVLIYFSLFLNIEANAINFRNTKHRAKLSDENKPRVSSAYTDYILSNNTPYNMHNYQRNHRLHQCESVNNTNLQSSINLEQQNIESVTR